MSRLQSLLRGESFTDAKDAKDGPLILDHTLAFTHEDILKVFSFSVQFTVCVGITFINGLWSEEGCINGKKDAAKVMSQ